MPAVLSKGFLHFADATVGMTTSLRRGDPFDAACGLAQDDTLQVKMFLVTEQSIIREKEILEHYTLKTLEFTGLLLDTRGVASYNVTRVFNQSQEARR